MKNRVAIVTHYCGNEGGGVTGVVNDSLPYLAGSAEVKLFGLESPRINLQFPNKFRWGRLGIDTSLVSDLLDWQPDLIHLHGLFTFVSRSALLAAISAGIPLIVSPHGMLDAWALNHRRLKKKLFLSLFERRVLEASDRIHALCASESLSISEIGVVNSKIRVIPNGIALPEYEPLKKEGIKFNLLYLGRLHPKKGLFELLHGLSRLRHTRSDLIGRLGVDIVGWGDDKYVAKLKKLVKSLGLDGFVLFRGAAFGEEKSRFFQSADAFILPSFSEGLPLAVLEAWSYGLPVLMTSECNLPEGFASMAAIQVNPKPEALANSIAAMLETPREELRAMGQRGLKLVCRKFSWDSVAKQYLDMYNEVLEDHEA